MTTTANDRTGLTNRVVDFALSEYAIACETQVAAAWRKVDMTESMRITEPAEPECGPGRLPVSIDFQSELELVHREMASH